MKLTALAIAMAALCMTLEGCDRYSGGETYGQKIDRAFEKINQSIVEAGDKPALGTDQVGNMMSLAAAAVSDTGWIAISASGDAAITASVKAALRKDPDLGVLNFDVQTRDGVVSLNGMTNDQEALARAERIARASKGVARVNSQLNVK